MFHGQLFHHQLLQKNSENDLFVGHLNYISFVSGRIKKVLLPLKFDQF